VVLPLRATALVLISALRRLNSLVQRKVVRRDVPRDLIDPLDVMGPKRGSVLPHDLLTRCLIDAIRLHNAGVVNDDMAVIPPDGARELFDRDLLRAAIHGRHLVLCDVKPPFHEKHRHELKANAVPVAYVETASESREWRSHSRQKKTNSFCRYRGS
jgi:hypothetical protein